MIRLIPYILYLLLIGMHQVIWKDVTSIYSVTISLTALLVFLVALYKSEVTVAWFGWTAGLVAGAGIPDLFGWTSLILALLAIVGFQVRERMNLDSIWAKLLMVGGGVLAYNLCWLALVQLESFWWRLLTEAIPSAVYTTIIAWLFFLIKEGKATPQKVRQIF